MTVPEGVNPELVALALTTGQDLEFRPVLQQLPPIPIAESRRTEPDPAATVVLSGQSEIIDGQEMLPRYELGPVPGSATPEPDDDLTGRILESVEVGSDGGGSTQAVLSPVMREGPDGIVQSSFERDQIQIGGGTDEEEVARTAFRLAVRSVTQWSTRG